MEQTVTNYGTIYLTLMTLIGFAIMGIDKRRAIRKAYRIPERTLFYISFLGGGIGTFIGMYVYHHKTKHARFIILLPLAALFNLFIALKLWGLF